MTLADCSEAISAYVELGCPPNAARIFRLEALAMRAAKGEASDHVRLALTVAAAIFGKIARKIEISEPVSGQGAWPDHQTVFRKSSEMIVTLKRPHDPAKVLDLLYHLNNFWIALSDQPL